MRGLLAAIAAGAVVAVAAVAQVGSDDESAIEARLETCAGAAAQEPCFRRVYDDVASSGEVAATLAGLESLAGRGEVDDCHLEAHRLAHAVYRVVGDVERTFLLGGPECRLGYLHGAVEASGSVAASGAGATHGVALPRCGRFRIASQRGACSHGFGHALMLRTRHDIRASMDGCRAASARGLEREPCENGVMMQNSLRYTGKREFAAASARGCSAVAESPRLARLCFDNVGVVAALSLGHDADRATAVCRRLPPGAARSSCVSGAIAEIEEARRGGAGEG